MSTVTLAASDGRTIVIKIDGATCTICGKRVTPEDFANGGRMIVTGDSEAAAFACVDHFLNPGSREYQRNMERLAVRVVANLKRSESTHR